MELLLNKEVEVASYDALATIGVESEKHAFLLRVLELAHEQAIQKSSIDHEIINEKLIMRPPSHAMGKRILGLLKEGGFIEESESIWDGYQTKTRYRLTELGESMVADNMIVVRETGPIVIHSSTDQLFTDYIIGYEAKKEAAYEEYGQVQERMRDRVRNQPKTAEPEWLRDYPGKDKNDKPVRIELILTGKSLVVYEIERPIIPNNNPKPPVTATLRLSIDNPPELRVSTNKGKHILVAEHNFRRDFEGVLRELLGERQSDLIKLDSGEFALLSSPDQLSDLEKNSMVSNMRFSNPKVSGFGASKDVTVQGIRLLPREEDDAVAWATWLLLERIGGYIDKKGYEALMDECAQLFNERFDAKRVKERMPSFYAVTSTVIHHRDSNPRMFWHIIAPTKLTADRRD